MRRGLLISMLQIVCFASVIDVSVYNSPHKLSHLRGRLTTGNS